MDIVAQTPANKDQRMDRYDLDPRYADGPICMAKATEPQQFTCRCGSSYQSEWVGRHTVRPMCPRCIAQEREKCGINHKPTRQPYPMPEMYAGDGSTLHQVAREWLEAGKRLLIISGPPGRGKTCQTHHLAAVAHDMRVRAVFIGDRQLMAPDEQRMQEWAGTPMLIIDEVGKRCGAGAVANLCDLVDRRALSNRRTVMVTNLTGAEVVALDARLASRARAATVLRLDGHDMRSRDAAPTGHVRRAD